VKKVKFWHGLQNFWLSVNRPIGVELAQELYLANAWKRPFWR